MGDIKRLCLRCQTMFVVPEELRKKLNSQQKSLPQFCPECEQEEKDIKPEIITQDKPEIFIEKVNKKEPKKSDKLICKCCNKPFTFTKEELEYYARHNQPTPTRCRKCLDTRKLKRDEKRRRRKAKEQVNTIDIPKQVITVKKVETKTQEIKTLEKQFNLSNEINSDRQLEPWQQKLLSLNIG